MYTACYKFTQLILKKKVIHGHIDAWCPNKSGPLVAQNLYETKCLPPSYSQYIFLEKLIMVRFQLWANVIGAGAGIGQFAEIEDWGND